MTYFGRPPGAPLFEALYDAMRDTLFLFERYLV